MATAIDIYGSDAGVSPAHSTASSGILCSIVSRPLAQLSTEIVLTAEESRAFEDMLQESPRSIPDLARILAGAR